MDLRLPPALSEPLKQCCADKGNIPQTNIIKIAISEYLKKEGYLK